MASWMYWATGCLGILTAIIALDFMGLFSRKNHFEVDGRTVLLTGGSQGMGRALGKLLAQKGANVVIVARNKQKLADALNYISSFARNPQAQRFHSISADLTTPDENIRILAETTAWNNGQPADIIWANAGAAQPGLFIDTDIAVCRSQMDTNYWTAAYLAHATLKTWLRLAAESKSNSSVAAAATKPRHFLMTSSVAAFVGIAGYAPYAPAKAALRSLADNLRSEVQLYNGYRRANPDVGPAADVNIHCVFPGTITSPGLEEENKSKHAVTKALEEGDASQTEDEAAVAAIKGLEKGGFLVSTQWLGELMRAGMMGGSARNSWVGDTVFGWLAYVVWLFVGPDLEGKVFKFGRDNKVALPAE